MTPQPNIILRRADERGHANHGWLDTFHTFSFANYFDPRWNGFHTLAVINEDRVQGNAGFPMHPHRDMEIITYIIEGQLAHKDSMGNGSVIGPGEFQKMSAGTGVRHSEFNPSEEPVHLLQIWIEPEKTGLEPMYQQKKFTREERTGQLRLVASQDARNDSLRIFQDVNLYSAILKPGQTIADRLGPGRSGWFQIVKGVLAVRIGAEQHEEVLSPGDALGIVGGASPEEGTSFEIHAPVAGSEAELLLFDLG